MLTMMMIMDDDACYYAYYDHITPMIMPVVPIIMPSIMPIMPIIMHLTPTIMPIMPIMPIRIGIL